MQAVTDAPALGLLNGAAARPAASSAPRLAAEGAAASADGTTVCIVKVHFLARSAFIVHPHPQVVEIAVTSALYRDDSSTRSCLIPISDTT